MTSSNIQYASNQYPVETNVKSIVVYGLIDSNEKVAFSQKANPVQD